MEEVKVGFQHPDYGIPCIAIWDEDGETLMFDIEDYEEAEKWNPAEDVEAVRQWCMRNAINCDSANRANNHLAFLGIKECIAD
jgi:hypothetical protein